MEKPLLVTTETTGSRDLRLTVEIPEERVQQEMRRVARKISEQVAIPGFRKGKAPYAVILQRYGEHTLREQVAEDLTREFYRAAIEQEGITPYGPANLDDVQLHPMRLTFTLSLPPIVHLGDYRSLRVEFPPVEITEEEILRVLEEIRQENAVLEPVEGRGAQPGDLLYIQVEGRTDRGQRFLQDDQAAVILNPDDPSPAPGFHRALEGMTPGEERTFRLKMPNGQPSEEAEFRVRLLSLARRILPDLDDDLARTAGPYPNLEALKEDIRRQLLQVKEQQAREDYAQQVIQRLVDQAEVEYPSALLDEQLDAMMEELDRRSREEQHMPLQDFLKLTGQTVESLLERLRPEADRRVRRMLVLGEVARAEGLDVREDEVDQRIQTLSEQWGSQAESWRAQLEKPENRERLSARILYEKVVDRLIAIARGELVPDPPAGGEYATP
ncbi:MAG: trigger factor [Anaerolineae bacterium]|nr:trigger factor [Anaerolineae bacterium]MDW8069643.1 trigger factor [Anaerolineae bacterium]